MTIFYCLRFEIPPTWRARSPYLYHPGTGWPGYTPRHWVLFSPPHTTRRATVEVFDPVSTRVYDSIFHIEFLHGHIENTSSNNYSLVCMISLSARTPYKTPIPAVPPLVTLQDPFQCYVTVYCPITS
jgi:hypothetical protein